MGPQSLGDETRTGLMGSAFHQSRQLFPGAWRDLHFLTLSRSGTGHATRFAKWNVSRNRTCHFGVETLTPRMWFSTHVFPLPWCWPHSSGCSICLGPGGGRSPSWPTMDFRSSYRAVELWGCSLPQRNFAHPGWYTGYMCNMKRFPLWVHSFWPFVPTYIMHLLCKRLKRNGIEKVSSKSTQDYIMCVCI